MVEDTSHSGRHFSPLSLRDQTVAKDCIAQPYQRNGGVPDEDAPWHDACVWLLEEKWNKGKSPGSLFSFSPLPEAATVQWDQWLR